MFNYNELIWKTYVFVFSLLAVWFSLALVLLLRSVRGHEKRQTVKKTIQKKESQGETVPALLRRDSKAILRRAVVVVGGDFARSPRMQYHAASLAKCGLFDGVILVGFDMGNSLIDALQPGKNDSLIEKSGCIVDTTHLIRRTEPPLWFKSVFRHPRLHWVVSVAYCAFAHALSFAWTLMVVLLMIVNNNGQLLLVDLILVQSPPAVIFVPIIKYIVRPCALLINAFIYYGFIIPASWIMRDALGEIRGGLKLQKELNIDKKKKTVSSFRSVIFPALFVDWHNFGYTILKSDGRPSLAVWVYWMIECHCCMGDRNLTVSKAMQKALYYLQGKKKLQRNEAHSSTSNEVAVLYDTAPSFFGPCSRGRFVQEVLRPIVESPREGATEVMGLSPPPAWVMETEMHDVDKATNTSAKGLIIVGATSWTADDDYTMLVEALVRVDKRLQKKQQEQQKGSSPDVVRPIWFLITGKGVSRERFERAVTEAHLSPLVTVTTIYFQAYVHYAMTLGAADAGFCLHHSSSGLDLPMKAVDMLGSGLPVVALRYEALSELLDEKSGWLFSDAAELETILWQISNADSVGVGESVKQKRLHVMQNRRKTWDENWNPVVMPLLHDVL